MKVKDLCEVISPLQDIQVYDSKTGEPYTECNYLADSCCDVLDAYGDYDLYGVAPKVGKDGNKYLALFVEVKV